MSGTYRALAHEEVLRFLLKKTPKLLLIHRNPDADAIGSAFALIEFLRALDIPAYCVCADEIPHRLRFLTNGVQESVLPASVPTSFAKADVVSLDVASTSQLGALYPTFGKDVALMIDHHENGEIFADYLRESRAAATGEILFDLFAEAKLSVPERCGELLYAAISADTGGFRFSNVTRETHLRAAALVAGGVDVAKISRALFETKSLSLLRAEHLGYEKMRILSEGKLSLIVLTFEEIARNDLADEDLSTVIELARSVEGVEVAAVLRQPKNEPRFRLSMRSVSTDVGAVCAKLGGGGHKLAAGATIEAQSEKEAVERLFAVLMPALR